MAFNDLERKRIEKALAAFIEKLRPPVHMRRKLDYGYRIAGQSVELVEMMPSFHDPEEIHEYPFAKATFIKTGNTWKLYWKRANLKWYPYDPSNYPSLESLLAEVKADEYGCFFG